MNETIAEILDCMRQDIADGTVGLWADFGAEIARCYVERIDEAWKRERKSVGNAANMREAMDAVIKVGDTDGYVRELNNIFTFFYRITVAIRKCREAISTPQRNCDRFATAEEAREAWMSLDDDSNEALNSFEWLYATVEE